MKRIVAATCAALMSAMLLVVGGGSALAADRPSVTMVIAPTADGLDWSTITPTGERTDGGGIALAIAAGSSVPVEWDLTALDRARYGSDLVRVEVVGFEGPGRLTVHGIAPHDRRALVFDGTVTTGGVDAPAMVLQVGRNTVQHWTIDQPGEHVVELRASIPVAGGGTAVDTVTYVIGGHEDGRSSRVMSRAAGGEVGLMAMSGGSGQVRAASPGGRAVIADGHVDVGPRIVDGHWRVQIKDDTVSPHVWRELSDVVLHARDSALVTVPDRPAYAFLGAPGTPYHILPQAQQQGIVWPGWNSQDPSVTTTVPGSVTWRLRGVDGPGRFALFVTDSFGDIEVYFDTNEAMPQDLSIPFNSHVHGNWAFGAPGVYHFEVEMRATLAEGGSVSDMRVLTVVVGDDVDPSTVATRDPGGPGQEVGPEGDGAAGSGDAEVELSTDLRGDGDDDDDAVGGSEVGGTGDSPGRSGPGQLVQTGVDALRTAAWAMALIGAGLIFHLWGRARSTKNESHS